MADRVNTCLQRSTAWVDWVSVGSLLLLVPLLLFPHGGLPILALGLALLLAIWRWATLGQPRLAVIDIPLFFLLCMALLGLAVSVDRSMSWPRFWSLVLGLLVFYTLRFSINPNSPSSAVWITVALAMAGLGLAGISLAGTDWHEVRFFDLPWLYERLPSLIRGLPGSGVPRASDLFNPRWVGITMGVLAPVFFALLAWRERPWLRALVLLAFLVAIGTLLLTQSVQGLLGLVAGTYVVLLYINRRFWLLLPLGILIAAGLIIWKGPVDLGTALLSRDNPVGVAVVLRLDIWSRAWAMLQDMPFTGIGLNTFPLIQSQFYTGYLIGPEPHAHNLYLQTMLDLGLPGLAAFLWFVVVWIVQVLKGIAQASMTANRFLLIGALAGIVSYLAHGFIDAMMLGAKPTIVVWALLGIGTALSSYRVSQSKTKPLKLTLAWIALPLVFGLLALLRPATVYMNIGALQSQRLLYPFPFVQDLSPNGLAISQNNLEKALSMNPSLRQPYLYLGRIASIQGDYSIAQQHYRNRVALDMQNPVASYNTAQLLRNWLVPQALQNPATELLKIYQAWNTRFPERAETFLLKSLVVSQYQADLARGQALLQEGVQENAQPLGLLLDVLERVAPP